MAEFEVSIVVIRDDTITMGVASILGGRTRIYVPLENDMLDEEVAWEALNRTNTFLQVIELVA